MRNDYDTVAIRWVGTSPGVKVEARYGPSDVILSVPCTEIVESAVSEILTALITGDGPALLMQIVERAETLAADTGAHPDETTWGDLVADMLGRAALELIGGSTGPAPATVSGAVLVDAIRQVQDARRRERAALGAFVA